MPSEMITDMRTRVVKVIRKLKKAYPDAKCSLDYETVHQLMVATILSAQCTDERVNMVTPVLFKKYRSVSEFAEADPKQLQEDVFTTGFYVNKAKAIKQSARQLLENHDGEIPQSLDALVKLTGVGRKTASVILGAGFGIAEGIVVDTHVGRINRLLGFTKEKDAVKIEKDLIKTVPKKDWIIYAHLMIDHGRAVCRARKPDCSNCPLASLCPSAKV